MKPEAAFVAAVNRLLPTHVYRQSMAFTMTNGTPDQYYSYDSDHPGRDLWVEYKWLTAPPLRLLVPKLTDLQKLWLDRRWKNSRNAFVIVGFPTAKGSRKRSGIVFKSPYEWSSGVLPQLQPNLPISVQSIAKEIETYVAAPPHI